MSISITPKNSTTIATQTMSIDELFEERYKERQTRDSKIVEELRPLCEDIPSCALDPVTYEPMKTPLVMRCGHTLSSKTAVSVAESKGLTKSDKIPCPVCRTETTGYSFFYDQSFDETVEHLEKVTKIFKRTVENNEEKSTKRAASFGSKKTKKRTCKSKYSSR